MYTQQLKSRSQILVGKGVIDQSSFQHINICTLVDTMYQDYENATKICKKNIIS